MIVPQQMVGQCAKPPFGAAFFAALCLGVANREILAIREFVLQVDSLLDSERIGAVAAAGYLDRRGTLSRGQNNVGLSSA